MRNRLIQITVDPEELIKQYNWLCNLVALTRERARVETGGEIDAVIGLQNLLEGLMLGLWGGTAIFDNDGETADRYLVIMPGRQYVYLMSHDADMPNGVCQLYRSDGEDAIQFTQLDNGDFVPIGYMKEVSIISVEPGCRRKILELISDDLEYYGEHLVIT